MSGLLKHQINKAKPPEKVQSAYRCHSSEKLTFPTLTRDTENLGKSQNKQSNLFFTSLVRQYTNTYLLKILNFIGNAKFSNLF